MSAKILVCNGIPIHSTSTEWRDMLIGKRKIISENQANILSAVGCEQKNSQNRERNVVLSGVPNSTAASEEDREKEDEKTTREVLVELKYD
jgi:hypothetical protein